MILNKTLEQWLTDFPILQQLMDLKELLWINPSMTDFHHGMERCPISLSEVEEADKRLQRFAPYIEGVFPETAPTKGIIESPIQQLPQMQELLSSSLAFPIAGNLWAKLDSHLPISGSIKARGGIYEVLTLAERLATVEGLLTPADDYSKLDSPEFRSYFGKYAIAVGSTGNLGLSIGIMGAKLGFRTTVHMSADARAWKKDLLRSHGVTVVEYDDDYSKAVEEGRKLAQADPLCHFVDDENSKTLFLGYAVAALRLKEQFKEKGIVVDREHPLFVYLPCGVGGGPGGVAFGLKQVFHDNVHCFFAEPTHSPCMLLGMATGYHDRVCVQDFGIDNHTAADGLAVGRASRFVGRTMSPFMSGIYTVSDNHLYQMLAQLADCEGLKLEPSALAGMVGASILANHPEAQAYCEKHHLNCSNATHLAWATGGNMVPEDNMREYYEKGKALI